MGCTHGAAPWAMRAKEASIELRRSWSCCSTATIAVGQAPNAPCPRQDGHTTFLSIGIVSFLWRCFSGIFLDFKLFYYCYQCTYSWGGDSRPPFMESRGPNLPIPHRPDPLPIGPSHKRVTGDFESRLG